MKPLRVLYLCEFPTLLGGELSLLHGLRAATEVIAPIVMAPAGGQLATHLEREGIQRWDWPVGGKTRIANAAEAVRHSQFDLVHANSLATADAALELGAICNLPAIAHVRDIARLSAAKSRRLSQLDAIVAVSDAVRRFLIDAAIASARCHRLYNPLDAEDLRQRSQPGELRLRLALPADAILIGCAGQIALRKGQDVFIRAAATVVRKLPNARFVVAGERFSQKLESIEFERSLRNLAAELLQASNPPALGAAAELVHWLGHVVEWPKLVCDLDLLVVPSRQEPLSRALLEAVAVGVRAVATDVGGNREILAHRSLGTLVPCDDATAMSAAILELLAVPHDKSAEAQTARERFKQRHAPAGYVEGLLALYSGAIKTAVGRGRHC